MMGNTFKNRTMVIEKILFNEQGKIAIKLEDGRLFIAPLRYFPELKKLSVVKRKKYTIVDDRTVLFSFANSIYHLEDFIGKESKWQQR